MVHTTVRPVFTVLRTAQERRHFSSSAGVNDILHSMAYICGQLWLAVIASSDCCAQGMTDVVTCPHDNGCSPCVQARGGLILHTTLPRLRLHRKESFLPVRSNKQPQQ